MDARLVFIACAHMLDKLEWPRRGTAKDSSEWVFTGMDNDFRATVAMELINPLLKEPEVYLVLGRNDSAQIPSTDLLRVIRENDFRLVLVKTDYSYAVVFKGNVAKVGYRT